MDDEEMIDCEELAEELEIVRVADFISLIVSSTIFGLLLIAIIVVLSLRCCIVEGDEEG